MRSSRPRPPPRPPTRPTGSSRASASCGEHAGRRIEVSAIVHGTTVATNQLLEDRDRRPRLHHHRGLRVHPGDRPAERPRRLRQLLLLGQAAADRPGAPGEDRRRAARPHRAPRCGRSTRSRPSRWPAGSASRGVTAIGVCFLHSYANPAHERRMREVLAREHPEAVVSISSDVLREYREYERSVTTLVDAAVKPPCGATSPTCRAGWARPFSVMKSQRRRAVGARGRQPADHHRAVRARRRARSARR